MHVALLAVRIDGLVTVERLVDLIVASESTVVLTGAGISTASGLPDYRSPSGLGRRHEEIAHETVLQREPELFWRYYRARFEDLARCEPNPGHLALAQLQAAGRVEAIVTQNVDGFHQAAGSSQVIELHGSLARVPSTACDHVSSPEELPDRYDARGIVRCSHCDGNLRPGVVLFGERLSARLIQRSYNLAYDADLLLCVGSSLQVTPAANVPVMAQRGGTAVAIINQGLTGFGATDLTIDADASVLLPAIAKRVLAR